MSTLTLENHRRVSMVVGQEVADVLDTLGLIRHDAWSAPKPTHYVLEVSVGKGPYQHNTWLRREIEDVYNFATNRTPPRFAGPNPTSRVSLEYKSHGAAKSQMRKAIACGLEARVVACILLPVDHVG